MSARPFRRALGAALLTLGLLPAAAPAAEPGVSVIGAANEPAWAADALAPAPAGKKWVYMPVSWAQLEPTRGSRPNQPPGDGVYKVIEGRIREFNQAGISVMLILTEAPDWAHPGQSGVNFPPKDEHFEAYADWASWLAADLKQKQLHVAAWQVWNEPNDGVFWIGGPEPARYSALLKATYPKLKAAAEPDALVVTGGLVHNDFEFVESLYRNGAGDSFDAVGTHMSTACLTRGPDFYERNQTSGRIDKYYFSGYREVHQQLADHGHGAKPIFMEIGWSTAAGFDCNVGSKKGPAGVTEAEQASFLTQAYRCLASDHHVRAAAWFSVRDAHDHYVSYDSMMGLVTATGGLRPSFGAMKAVAGGVSPAFCGGRVDRDVPSATIEVPDQFFTRVVVSGKATDPTTPVKKIELWVDGKRVEGANQDGGTYKNDWFGSTKLDYGKHTFELRAYDEALNVARATKVVTKVDPAKATGTYRPRLRFAAKKVGSGKIRISARVLRALDFPEDPKGRLRIFFERRTGKRWKPYSRYTKGISRPIRMTYDARRPGKWRVWARLAVDAPYKPLRTKKHVFKLR